MAIRGANIYQAADGCTLGEGVTCIGANEVGFNGASDFLSFDIVACNLNKPCP